MIIKGGLFEQGNLLVGGRGKEKVTGQEGEESSEYY
jgi:hypothetical protein